jgi:hypothetical protein
LPDAPNTNSRTSSWRPRISRSRMSTSTPHTTLPAPTSLCESVYCSLVLLRGILRLNLPLHH